MARKPVLLTKAQRRKRPPGTPWEKGSKHHPNVERAARVAEKYDRTMDPDLRTVIGMAKIGASDEEIAEMFACTATNIRLKYFDVLVKSRAQMKRSLRRAQWRLAVDHLDKTMLIWLGKQMLGQRETAITVDWNALTDEQLADIEQGKMPKGLKR